MKFTMKKNESGFSLVELMIVVGIIGILAALALPKMQVFMAKAKQSEAKGTLSQIYTLQMSNFAEKDTYDTLANIGFVAATGARYTFTGSAASTTAFTATAASVSPLCAGASTDTWTINEAKTLTNTVKGINCN